VLAEFPAPDDHPPGQTRNGSPPHTICLTPYHPVDDHQTGRLRRYWDGSGHAHRRPSRMARNSPHTEFAVARLSTTVRGRWMSSFQTEVRTPSRCNERSASRTHHRQSHIPCSRLSTVETKVPLRQNLSTKLRMAFPPMWTSPTRSRHGKGSHHAASPRGSLSVIDGDRSVPIRRSIASREGTTPRREGADRKRLYQRRAREEGERGNQECWRTMIGTLNTVLHFPSLAADQSLAMS
jgi:hypothetical protein